MFHSYLKQFTNCSNWCTISSTVCHLYSFVGDAFWKIVMKMGKWGAVPVNVSARSTWSSSHRTHSGAFLGIDLTPLTPHFSGNLLCDPWPHHWTSDWVSPSHRHCLILGEFGMLQNGQHIFAWEPLHMPTQRILGYKTFQARYFQMQTSCPPSKFFSLCDLHRETSTGCSSGSLRMWPHKLRWGIIGCGPISADWCKSLKDGGWKDMERGLEGLIQGGPAPHVICQEGDDCRHCWD